MSSDGVQGEDLPSVARDVISSDKPPNPPQSPSALCPAFPARPLSGKVEQSIPLAHHKQRTAEKVQTVPECWWKKKEEKEHSKQLLRLLFPHPLRSFGSFKSLVGKARDLKFLELLKHER